MSAQVSDPVWEAAQRAERGYWSGVLDDGTKGPAFFRTMDWTMQHPYIALLAKWVGIYRPEDLVVEIGCGPCGLGPWMRPKRLVGLDPMIEWFRSRRSAYDGLGYSAVGVGRAEDASESLVKIGVDPAEVGIVLCCNVLDHTTTLAEALRGIAALGRTGTEALLAYDLRIVATCLHPILIGGDTVSTIMGEFGWVRPDFETMPPAPWHTQESAGVRAEHYRKGG